MSTAKQPQQELLIEIAAPQIPQDPEIAHPPAYERPIADSPGPVRSITGGRSTPSGESRSLRLFSPGGVGASASKSSWGTDLIVCARTEDVQWEEGESHASWPGTVPKTSAGPVKKHTLRSEASGTPLVDRARLHSEPNVTSDRAKIATATTPFMMGAKLRF
nr:uncharacterized protein CTRU02_03372 [Colletotrichum truncatum]KAF6797341.1 hypothetical protein CTRU02_03372 [Colletotrichum truncatum]